MPEEGDAFGELLRTHHAGEHSYEVHQRDDGWVAPMGDVGTYFAEPSAWPERERAALEWVEGRDLVADTPWTVAEAHEDGAATTSRN